MRDSRIGVVTPLRDGMNLVAKEYVAAQNPEDPGVLMLSRFAGAAEQMKEALIVNPYDVEEMADTIKIALEMDVEERRERHRALLDGIRTHDTFAWRRAVPSSPRSRTFVPPPAAAARRRAVRSGAQGAGGEGVGSGRVPAHATPLTAPLASAHEADRNGNKEIGALIGRRRCHSSFNLLLQ